MLDTQFDYRPQRTNDPAFRDVLSLAYVHRFRVIIAICVISTIILCIGWFWPKSYASNATIIFENKNIIQPLLDGAAVPADISARAETARELMFSRSVLADVAEVGGWLDDSSSLLAREKRNDITRRRLSVKPIGAHLIRIEFKDESPATSLAVADFLSDTFVTESQKMQIDESNTAFQFIDAQVSGYREKLLASEQSLMEYNSDNLASRPSNDIAVGLKISDLELQIEATEVRLAEVRKIRSALRGRMNSQSEVVTSLDNERALRAFLAGANKRLATLRLLYHDTYPDIVQILDQIDELEIKIAIEQASRGDSEATIDDSYFDPKTGQTVSLYQQLRRDFSVADTEFKSLQARLKEQRRQRDSEIRRGIRINENAAMLSELTRDYDVNKTVHRDLLRRRENARVSMNLDQNKQGLSIRVYERAFLPLKPSGLRFLHFAIFGIVFGVAAPFAFIYIFYTTSKRIRSAKRIEQLFDIPLLVSIPHMQVEAEVTSQRRRMIAATLVAIIAVTIYLALGFIRFTGFQIGSSL
jgi:polysaccharide chain length determinant protein (PEP-CTERM system associated)